MLAEKEQWMNRIILTLLFVPSSPLTLGGSRPAQAEGGNQETAVTLIAAGDFACDPARPRFNGAQGDDRYCQMQATSDRLLNGHPDAVLALGDEQHNFGSGPGCSSLVMSTTGDQRAGTMHHWLVVTGNDLPESVGDIGIVPGTTYLL